MTRTKVGDTACSQWNLYWLPNKEYQIKTHKQKTTQGDPPPPNRQTNFSFILKGSTIWQ